MTDPFRALALRGRIKTIGGGVLVAAVLFAISWFRFGAAMTDGREVSAEVLRLGTHPAGRAVGGDQPILTVRLPDGSVQEVLATWADLDRCRPGASISLLQQGSALRVIRQPGCAGGL